VGMAGEEEGRVKTPLTLPLSPMNECVCMRVCVYLCVNVCGKGSDEEKVLTRHVRPPCEAAAPALSGGAWYCNTKAVVRCQVDDGQVVVCPRQQEIEPEPECAAESGSVRGVRGIAQAVRG